MTYKKLGGLSILRVKKMYFYKFRSYNLVVQSFILESIE